MSQAGYGAIWLRFWRYWSSFCPALFPAEDAFSGFSNPAVITAVAVLVISKSLEHAEITDVAGKAAGMAGSSTTLQVGFFCVVVGFLSAFINSVGALALMMPVAIETARREKRSPSYLLMPMAFASLLGGMTTLIGTPPNRLVSDYRCARIGSQYTMLEFTPAGLPVAIIGIALMSQMCWRLIPRTVAGTGGELFDTENYLAEVIVPKGSGLEGENWRDVLLRYDDVTLVGFRM